MAFLILVSIRIKVGIITHFTGMFPFHSPCHGACKIVIHFIFFLKFILSILRRSWYSCLATLYSRGVGSFSLIITQALSISDISFKLVVFESSIMIFYVCEGRESRTPVIRAKLGKINTLHLIKNTITNGLPDILPLNYSPDCPPLRRAIGFGIYILVEDFHLTPAFSGALSC